MRAVKSRFSRMRVRETKSCALLKGSSKPIKWRVSTTMVVSWEEITGHQSTLTPCIVGGLSNSVLIIKSILKELRGSSIRQFMIDLN